MNVRERIQSMPESRKTKMAPQAKANWFGRLALAIALAAQPAFAYNNGDMTLKPPLGWQTWCSSGPCGTGE